MPSSEKMTAAREGGASELLGCTAHSLAPAAKAHCHAFSVQHVGDGTGHFPTSWCDMQSKAFSLREERKRSCAVAPASQSGVSALLRGGAPPETDMV